MLIHTFNITLLKQNAYRNLSELFFLCLVIVWQFIDVTSFNKRLDCILEFKICFYAFRQATRPPRTLREQLLEKKIDSIGPLFNFKVIT